MEAEMWIATTEGKQLVAGANQTYFWTGVREAEAAQLAEKSGGKTLEMMIREKNLHYPSIATDHAWDILAEQFAANASGEVTVFVGKYSRGPASTWQRIELPALRKNPNVTKITELTVDDAGKVIKTTDIPLK